MRHPSWLVLARDRPEAAVGLANSAVMVGGGVLLAFVVGWWALGVVVRVAGGYRAVAGAALA